MRGLITDFNCVYPSTLTCINKQNKRLGCSLPTHELFQIKILSLEIDLRILSIIRNLQAISYLIAYKHPTTIGLNKDFWAKPGFFKDFIDSKCWRESHNEVMNKRLLSYISRIDLAIKKKKVPSSSPCVRPLTHHMHFHCGLLLLYFLQHEKCRRQEDCYSEIPVRGCLSLHFPRFPHVVEMGHRWSSRRCEPGPENSRKQSRSHALRHCKPSVPL